MTTVGYGRTPTDTSAALLHRSAVTGVAMKNVVFWDIRTHFVLHRRHITSPLQSPAGQWYIRFKVFTAATMKDAVF
jgi:hypothetical protein